MTQRRIDYWYGRRMILVNALYLVPGLIALVLAVGQADFGGWFFAWGGVFLACVAAGIAVTIRRRIQGYACPQCGARIPAPARKPTRPGETFDYYCPGCDVLWYTRLRVLDGGRLTR